MVSGSVKYMSFADASQHEEASIHSEVESEDESFHEITMSEAES